MPGRDGTGGGRGMGGGGRGMGGKGRGMGGANNSGRNIKANASVPDPKSSEHLVTKIAVSSEGPTLDDRVDPRFGRAGGFVLVDMNTMAIEYLSNGTSQAMAQGAGIQSAETIANAGAQVLLTGYVGPKAFSALSAAGVMIGQDVDGMTVREAVEKYRKGDVPMADTPNRQVGTPS